MRMECARGHCILDSCGNTRLGIFMIGVKCADAVSLVPVLVYFTLVIKRN
jgi:hypothetical protein